jgi:8-oxo-dGTP pyrophosphatase MutT (NUDIX family)
VDQSNRHHRQIGALPLIFDAHGRPDLCLVTTRGGRRWIIPKGNPIAGLAPPEVAEREAFEEAGLLGAVGRASIGSFDFERRRAGRPEICIVDVYPLFVERRLPIWAEWRTRSVIQCDPETAATLLKLPALSALIEKFLSDCLRREAARA